MLKNEKLDCSAESSYDIQTDEESSTPKIKCQRQSCENYCCPCNGDICYDLCKYGNIKYNVCAKTCCAMELRNVTEVPKILSIPHDQVYLVIQNTDIQIIRHHSLQMTHTWKEITITFSKITTIQNNAFKGFIQLRRLFLNDNLISYFYHGTFSDLKNLIYLTVARNRLTSVFTITGLKHLDLLVLSSNRITHLDNNNFSPCTNAEINILDDCKITNIDTIDLSDNNLTTIAKNSFRHLESLRILNFSENRLTELRDKVLEEKTKLIVLYLSNNEINHFTKDSFPGTLIRLELDGNRLMHLKLSMFSKMRTLEFLYLHNNNITVIDEDTFKFNTNVKKILLQGNRLRIIEDETFKYNKILQELNLNGNDISTCYWLTHLSKTLRVFELKFPSVSNESCSKHKKCKIYEESVIQTVTFKLPEFKKNTFFHRLQKYYSGGRKDSKRYHRGSVSDFKDTPCTFCQCQIQKGICLHYFFFHDNHLKTKFTSDKLKQNIYSKK